MKVKDAANAASGEATRPVTVNSVAPTVGAISGLTTVLTNRTYNYSASATDVSAADTAAGFSWAWDPGSGAFGTYGNLMANLNKQPISFSDCGSYTIRAKAKAKVKDDSEPAAASLTVAAFDGSVQPPLKGSGVINMVQKSQVVPVKIDVSCNGFISGLTPAMQLYSGDVDPDTDTTAPRRRSRSRSRRRHERVNARGR